MSGLKPVSFRQERAHEPRLSAPHVPGKHNDRYWTEAEDEIIRKYYPAGGYAACAAHLPPHRSRLSVYQRTNVLGVKRNAGERALTVKLPDDIDDKLREFYRDGDGKKRGECNDFADSLGLPRWKVTHRAIKLGLVMPHKKEPPWTAAELALMPKLPLHDVEKSARIMRQHGFARSPTAIMVKAKRLNLSRRYRETLSATAVGRILGVDAKTVTREILQGDLKAEKRETQRRIQQGGDPWSITPANLRRYILDNLARIDLRKVDKFAFVQIVAAEALEQSKEAA